MNADIGNTENLGLLLLAAWVLICVVWPIARAMARAIIELVHGPELAPVSPYQGIDQ